jgi:hypothetical protein
MELVTFCVGTFFGFWRFRPGTRDWEVPAFTEQVNDLYMKKIQDLEIIK